MRPRSSDAEVDKLYQLPLEEFTAARNALAREAGADGGEIRRLPKPPVAAWAVNQLYWKEREVYEELVDAAKELRGAHKAVLGGRRGDLRTASKMHDEALDRALTATLELLKDSGQNASDATRQAILNTLRALPSTDPPGRLGRTLQPGGFEMLADLPVAAGKRSSAPARAPAAPAPASRPRETKSARDDRAAAARRTAARKALADATREAREADTELRRQEFAAARAAKEAERAEQRLEQAREALAATERELQEAERDAAAAAKGRERASRAAADAQAAAQNARARLERAQQGLDELGTD